MRLIGRHFSPVISEMVGAQGSKFVIIFIEVSLDYCLVDFVTRMKNVHMFGNFQWISIFWGKV